MSFFTGLGAALGGLGGSMSKTLGDIQEQERMKRAEESKVMMEQARMNQAWDIESGRISQMEQNRAQEKELHALDIEAAKDAAILAQENREWEQEEARVAAHDLAMLQQQHAMEQIEAENEKQVALQALRNRDQRGLSAHELSMEAGGDPERHYFARGEGTADDEMVHAQVGVDALVQSGWNRAEAIRLLTENQRYSDEEANLIVDMGAGFARQNPMDLSKVQGLYETEAPAVDAGGGGGGFFDFITGGARSERPRQADITLSPTYQARQQGLSALQEIEPGYEPTDKRIPWFGSGGRREMMAEAMEAEADQINALFDERVAAVEAQFANVGGVKPEAYHQALAELEENRKRTLLFRPR